MSDDAHVTTAERVYFVAVGVLAGWVGLPAFLFPDKSDKVLPLGVPPLHARFIGAFYVSGLAIMIGAALARRWPEIRVVPLLTAIWTGGLMIVTFLNHDDFDFTTIQTQVWTAAYIAYPLIGLWIHFRRRRESALSDGGDGLPAWARPCLTAQGVVLCAVAVALLLARSTVAEAWPWPVEPLLAQIYGAPLLTYGVGSLLLARARTSSELRVVLTGIGLFSLGALVASLLHVELFDAGDAAAWVWFFALAAMTLLAALLLVGTRTYERV